MDQSVIVDLLLRWEKERSRGVVLSPEELCRDCPELVEEIRLRLNDQRTLRPSGQSQDTLQPLLDPNETNCQTPLEGDADQLVGDRYRLLRFHAEGGLGEVLIAHDQELNREVAVKRMKSHCREWQEGRRRFLLEAEITGRLDHPGVVPVHGLVADPEGHPYYSMRFIQGQTLQDAIQQFHQADKVERDPGERSVAFRQLLQRLIAVCNTIAYAHSRGIVHRDIKPGNIMLGKYGETLVVDWGLAKAIGRGDDGKSSEESTLVPGSDGGEGKTRMDEAMGTVQYMAPEQASGRWDMVRETSDIYSLGATLYAVLTGQSPVKDSAEIERVKSGDITPPRKIKKEVPAALEAICLKAMALRREDRYKTALDVAIDLENWLADEPVSSHQATWKERLIRWRRGNPALTAAGITSLIFALVVLSGATFLISKSLQQEKQLTKKALFAEIQALDEGQKAAEAKQRAEDASEKAKAQARTATAFSDFLVKIFQAGDQTGFKGFSLRRPEEIKEITIKELLRRGADLAEKELGKDPRAEAAILATIGSVNRTLGLTDLARKQIEKARAILQTQPNADPRDQANALFQLGWLEHEQGDYTKAESLYREALALRRVSYGPDELETLEIEFHIAWLLTQSDDFEEAEKLYTHVINHRLRILGKGDLQVFIAYGGMAALLLEQERTTEAMTYTALAVAGLAKEFGDVRLINAVVLYQTAISDLRNSRFDRAKQNLSACLVKAEEILGPQHQYLSLVLCDLGSACEYAGDDVQAEAAYRRCLEIIDRTVKFTHPRVDFAVAHYAELLQRQGRFSEGVVLYQKLLEAKERCYGQDNRFFAEVLGSFAVYLAGEGPDPRALDMARRAYDLVKKKKVQNPIAKGSICAQYAAVLGKTGQASEEERLFREALTVTAASWKDKNISRGKLLLGVARGLIDQGKTKEAEQYLDEGSTIVRGDPFSLGQIQVMDVAGRWHRVRGEWKECERYYRQAVELSKAAIPKDPNRLAIEQGYLGGVLVEEKKYAEAASLFEEVVAFREAQPGWRSWKLRKSIRDESLARLAQGDQTKYRALAGRLIREAAVAEDAAVAAEAVAVWALGPGDIKDGPAALKLAEEAVRRQPDLQRGRLARGTCLLRLGRNEEALKEFQEVEIRRHPEDTSTIILYMAIALARSGKVKEARQRLESVAPNQSAPPEGPPTSWQERLEENLLRQEATALIHVGRTSGPSP